MTDIFIMYTLLTNALMLKFLIMWSFQYILASNVALAGVSQFLQGYALHVKLNARTCIKNAPIFSSFLFKLYFIMNVQGILLRTIHI